MSRVILQRLSPCLPRIWLGLLAILAVETAALAQERSSDPEAQAWAAARYGDWTVIVGSGATEAGTYDDAGDAFGFACSLSCVHYLDLQRECRDGSGYDGSATVGEKVFPLTVTCHDVRGRHVFLIKMTSDYLTALGDGKAVTVQVRFAEGDTKSADFSLNGCSEAATAAAKIAFLFGREEPAPGTRI